MDIINGAERQKSLKRDNSVAEIRPHKPKAVGAIPTPATN